MWKHTTNNITNNGANNNVHNNNDTDRPLASSINWYAPSKGSSSYDDSTQIARALSGAYSTEIRIINLIITFQVLVVAVVVSIN